MVEYSNLQNKRQKLSDIIPLDTPFGIYIDPTNNCNFHCSFCPRNLDDFSEFAGHYKNMSYDLFSKIVEDIKEFHKKLKVIRLYFLGEPFINRDFIKMFELLVKEDICDRIEITTNGSLLSHEYSDEIIRIAKEYSGDIYVRFSIYGTSKDIYETVCRTDVDPQSIRDNISYLFEKRNSENVKNLFIYAKKLNTFNSENEIFYLQYRPIVDEVALEEPMNWSGAEKTDLLKESFSNEQRSKLEVHQMPKVCSYPFTTMAINSDGTVVSCCVDWSRKTYVGNVNENSLKEIWGTLFNELRLMHLKGERYKNDACKNCHRLPLFEDDNLDDVSPETFANKNESLS